MNSAEDHWGFITSTVAKPNCFHRKLNQVSMQRYSSLPVLAGLMQSPEEVVILPSQSSSLLQTGSSCSLSNFYPFQQLRVFSPMSPLAEGKSPAGWYHQILQLRTLWACIAPLTFRSSDLKTFIFQEVPNTSKNLPCCRIFPTCAYVSTGATDMKLSISKRIP